LPVEISIDDLSLPDIMLGEKLAGRTFALAARGRGNATSNAISLSLTATRKDDARLLPLIVKTLKHGGCESPVDIADGERQKELHRLSASQVLLVLECGRGAYQSSFELWTASDKAPYAPKPVKLPDANGRRDAYLMNPGFDNNQLKSFGKGRGIGDSNVAATWAWTATGFQLIEASSGQLGRGIPGGYPLRDYTATVIDPAGK